MKLFRFVVMVAVLAYAGWMAWPFLSPFVEGAALETAALRAAAETGGSGTLFGFLPVWMLWVAAIGLYVIAALMLGGGDRRAVGAYLLGFLADAGLRLALDRQGEDGSTSGPATVATPEALSSLPVEPLWLLLGGLLALGALVMIAGRRIRRGRTPGQLAY